MSTVVWNPGLSLAAIEKEIIQRAYEHFQKNKQQTAQSLGIAVRTLEYKLQQYDEELQRFKQDEEIRKQRAQEQLLQARFGRAYQPPQPAVSAKPVAVQTTTLRKKAK